MTSPTTVYHAPTIRGGALVIHREGETKTCRTCKQERPLAWFYRRFDHGRMGRHHQCKICKAAYARTRYHALRANRAADRETRRRPIPTSNLSLDLEIIAICWGDCVEVGPWAIVRMMERIVDSCVGIHGSFHLRGAAQDYLAGIGDLAMVQRALEDCVGLAVGA